MTSFVQSQKCPLSFKGLHNICCEHNGGLVWLDLDKRLRIRNCKRQLIGNDQLSSVEKCFPLFLKQQIDLN